VKPLGALGVDTGRFIEVDLTGDVDVEDRVEVDPFAAANGE